MTAPVVPVSRGGHVYVLAGDVTSLACDAWLLPTDEAFRVTRAFGAAVGRTGGGRIEGLEWGGARVRRFEPQGPGPQIWLGDVGRGGKDARWYADCVGPFVRGATRHVPPRPGGLPPLLAVNVLGTGQGGIGADKGAIHELLLPAIYQAVNDHHADVALVCWHRQAYSAAQRVRQRMLEGSDRAAFWDLGDRSAALVGHACRLAAQARQRDLVLFVGAGVSAGAGLPAWQAMLDGIAAELGFDDSLLHRLRGLDLRDQAAVLGRRLADKQGTTTLQEAITKHLKATRYSLAHGLLASLPSNEAVTTNYDQLFEAAATAVDEEIAVLPYEPVPPGRRWLLKLHGSIDRDESIVLTRSDYLGVPSSHGALFGLVQAMMLTRHMLFVGYSLSDEDFHQLVHEVRSARAQKPGADKLGTVLTLFDDELFAELWNDDLEVVALADQPPGSPSADEIATAARRLQIFLDLLGYEASDLDSFLLDPTYRGLLNEDERKLVAQLAPLASIDDRLPVAARLKQFLRELGAGSEDA